MIVVTLILTTQVWRLLRNRGTLCITWTLNDINSVLSVICPCW